MISCKIRIRKRGNHKNPDAMEEEKGLAESEEPKPSLFPLFPASDSSQSHSHQLITPTPPTQWLSNSSFTADLSVINDAVSIQPQPQPLLEEEEEEEVEEPEEKQPKSKEYEFLESDQDDNKKNSKIKKKKKKKRKRSKEREDGARKSGVRAWAGSDSNSNSNSKDYYFESRGDPDNLAFGSLYRLGYLQTYI